MEATEQGSGEGSRPGQGGQGGAYSADFFWYSFKIVPCTASYAHNWSLCPFVHPNEKARRRDPRVYSYEPLPCPFDKKGANCPHGDACTYTHNVYEYWLHPKRFRTQMCQQGAGCKRPLCFFAHNLQELRFSEGQLQQSSAPQSQDPSAALAAASPQAGLVQGMPDIRQQQQQQQHAAAAAAAMGAGQYVPYAVMPSGAGGMSLPPLQPGFIPSPVAASPGVPHGRQLGSAAGQAMQQQAMQQQQQLLQQQQGWMPQGYMTPQGYITPQGYYLVGAGQAQAYPGSTFMSGAEMVSSSPHQQQQQQYLPATSSRWQAPRGTPAGMAGNVQLQMRPAGMQLDPALMGSQFQVVPADDQVLLGRGAGGPGDSSSHSLLAAQQQQAQQDAAAGAVSGSQYSWNLNPGVPGPSTTSASVSMSLLSMPGMGLNSSASVPGSSNNSLSAHIRPGQAGAVSLDVLQATMQHMSIRDCHVRDL